MSELDAAERHDKPSGERERETLAVPKKVQKRQRMSD
jgi:hypothetical protein